MCKMISSGKWKISIRREHRPVRNISVRSAHKSACSQRNDCGLPCDGSSHRRGVWVDCKTAAPRRGPPDDARELVREKARPLFGLVNFVVVAAERERVRRGERQRRPGRLVPLFYALSLIDERSAESVMQARGSEKSVDV